MTKSIGIVLHPGKQRLCDLVRAMICGLADFDPVTKQVFNQHAEVAARVIDLVGVFVKSGNKGLEQAFLADYDKTKISSGILILEDIDEKGHGF